VPAFLIFLKRTIPVFQNFSKADKVYLELWGKAGVTNREISGSTA
jgi:hypothetical protein